MTLQTVLSGLVVPLLDSAFKKNFSLCSTIGYGFRLCSEAGWGFCLGSVVSWATIQTPKSSLVEWGHRLCSLAPFGVTDWTLFSMVLVLPLGRIVGCIMLSHEVID